jgi:hypothetical protein
MTRKHFKLLTVMATLAAVLTLCCASASAVTVSRGGPALVSASADTASLPAGLSAGAAAPGSVPQIPSQCGAMWCVFVERGYHGASCTGTGNRTDLGYCRNADRSVTNEIANCGAPPNNSCSLRLYYHPLNVDGGGAHVCIPYGVNIPDLSGYDFNSGPGEPGYGYPVFDDAGGLTLSHSPCTNPV